MSTKNILILGGTHFIGRNLVEKLLNVNEYKITLFNRQRTGTHLFPEIQKLKGDRETHEIRQIKGKKWNYIIDLSCYYPDSLQRALNSIESVDKYIFISTCSVYDNEKNNDILKDETSPIWPCTAEQKKDTNPETYGNRKAECERILKKSGIPYIILRPALVFGKYDSTDRMYYWLHQVKTKSQLLLPENGIRTFSTTYVADLVNTIIQSLKLDLSSEIYNVISRPQTSIKQIIEYARDILQMEYSAKEASLAFLNEKKVNQWTDIPLWINGDHFTYSNQKLINDLGISLTDFSLAIETTINYYEGQEWPKPTYGMDENRKQDLLAQLIKANNKVY